MLRLARSFPFFNQPEANPAQSFIHPTNGFSISVPTKCSLDNYYGPGTVFNGQLNLQLVKHISSPCRLRVILTCYHTIPEATSPATLDHQLSDSTAATAPAATSVPRNSSSSTSSSLSAGSGQEHYQQPQSQLFTVEHVLVVDQALVAKRHSYLFNIKFPRVNLPASMTDGDRSVAYSIHGELTFETSTGDIASKSSVCSPPVHLKYLPIVPTSIPHFPVIEMAQVQDPYNGQTLFKATLQSPQRGLCPGESLPLSITLTNESDTELQFIHLGLVRVISYPNAALAHATPAPTPEPVTVHSVTIPVAKVGNKHSTWVEAIQFKVPSNLGLIPTTNKVITPLYKVDYYLSVSLPVASRHTGLASWFTPTVKGPPPVDISLIRPNADATATTGSNGVENRPKRKTSGDKLIRINLQQDRITTVNSSMKWPTLIQLPLVPVIIGTVPYSVSERQLRWPIPNYLDVMDRPRFVRDRFEEEMIQHLKSLETLIVDEDDEQDIESLVRAARRSGSSGESDDEENQKASTRIPLRFRDRVAHRQGSGSSAGLGTPPPSPPQGSPMDSIASGMHTLPRMTRRSMSPKATGLGKELLLEMHHSKIQQSIQSGLQDI